MKKIFFKIQIFTVLVSMFALSSCIDNLLEQLPTTELGQDVFWKTPDDAQMALYGAYSDIRWYFDREMFWDGHGEFVGVAGTINGVDAGNLRAGDAYNTSYANPSSYGSGFDKLFTYLYGGINHVNYVIDNVEKMLPDAKTADVSKLEAIEGEARLLRGLCYFKLISLWGDVPLIDHIVENKAEVEDISRTPIAQIKSFIYDDFTYAYEKLPVKPPAVGSVGKPAALALRGKLQLYWACWNRFGWPELEDFTPSESEAVEAYNAAANDFAHVIDDYGLNLYKNGEPGECDVLGKAGKLPNYYELFTPEANGNEECLMVFTHGGPGTSQGEDIMRHVGASRHESGQARIVPLYEIADRYQSTETGDFCDPLIPLTPEGTTDGVPNREVKNSAVNPQSYANRDYRMKSSIMWDYEMSQGMLSLQSIGWVPFIYRTWTATVNIEGVNYVTPGIAYSTCAGYLFRKFLRRTAGAGRSDGNYNSAVIRLADVYLMYAEADNAVNGPKPKAIEVVNKVRHRGNLPALKPEKTANKDVFFDAIEQERIVEFLGEGTRPFDLRRWRTLEKTWGGVAGPGRWRIDSWGQQKERFFQNATELTFQRCYIFRIPPGERDKNPNLTQNRPWL